MAHHQSAKKRIRQSEARRLHNKYYGRSTRSAIRTLRSITDKEEAEKLLPSVTSLIDRLEKKNIIHKNKAANLKSGLALHVSKL